ncbi:galactokinase [Deinobacterium chartae]|uniref:Galactokinase n=1 Tax=Deinobacterium chartae TaxID=521158 RepID=A0A841I3F6_9DEIO|nr:galactokinase [Deinobacterium chartae]
MSHGKTFLEVYGHEPELTSKAPGRVNLLGEHTDYNGGYVLPTAIPQLTTVQVARGQGRHEVYSADLEEAYAFGDDGELDGFARYVGGCIRVLESEGFEVPPLRLWVASEVPMGAGLSSSAALEVAVLRAINDLLGLGLDGVRIAQLGQRAEIEHAGVQCGIMDQMASSLADAEHMLFLDTLTLERRVLPLPAGTEVLVVDSGVARSLAGSGYNERRAQCEEACALLGVKFLREVTDAAALEALPDLLKRRARHVVTENARVLEALSADAAEFGRLMNASHASLRDDYEVSVPPLDELVARLQERPEVYGARLTGAGFGGACVALVRAGTALEVGRSVLEGYEAAGHPGGRVVVPEPLRG